MTYVMSDIHGGFEQYQAMLEKIGLRDEDTLYILGDVIDRRPGGVEILQDMMLRPNVVPLLGNHELMAASCLPWLMETITEESVGRLNRGNLGSLQDWMNNGGGTTLEALWKLGEEERQDILDYLRDFSLYEEVEVAGRSFVLVHAGLDNFSPDRPLDRYEPMDFLFCRPGPDTAYWPDRLVILGHTPTWYLSGENKILRRDTWIDIDCGCGSGGPLGCLCLDTLEECYT